jgi:hypothetical protein
MTTVNPLHPAALGLLALLPVAVYAVLRPASVVVLSAVCVGLIAGSLYLLFGATEAETSAETHAA